MTESAHCCNARLPLLRTMRWARDRLCRVGFSSYAVAENRRLGTRSRSPVDVGKSVPLYHQSLLLLLFCIARSRCVFPSPLPFIVTYRL